MSVHFLSSSASLLSFFTVLLFSHYWVMPYQSHILLPFFQLSYSAFIFTWHVDGWCVIWAFKFTLRPSDKDIGILYTRTPSLSTHKLEQVWSITLHKHLPPPALPLPLSSRSLSLTPSGLIPEFVLKLLSSSPLSPVFCDSLKSLTLSHPPLKVSRFG